MIWCIRCVEVARKIEMKDKGIDIDISSCDREWRVLEVERY